MVFGMMAQELIVEAIGWISTFAFLFSIVVPKRERLHQLGVFAAITTGVYAFAHGATAIWVKWVIAFFFHAYMIYKIRRSGENPPSPRGSTLDLSPPS